ncbi:SCO family protein [Streptomyces sp. TRM43335]|uniref:SCO family protein n=1 Tax=Streptomyces taklimakanensis TaxID=2569853 RepID=A0A6G2BCZ1_9ACTN|nr:SCO family protein [Streptomyces taklimakanensis]MTE20084.1 SCO family protein [Streptomyces taklimakanensis]
MHRTTRRHPRRTRPTALPARRALGLALAGALLATGATACGSGGEDGSDRARTAAEATDSVKRGTVLSNPFDKPDLVLTDTEGESYDLVEETAGHPTLIYFGYTHCPDVCPLTMSNIAVAKSELPEAEQEKLRVVFVTSDPERDTPESLGTWLRAQDPDFIGLTGDFDTIQAGARDLGIGLEPPVVEEDGDVVSSHGTQVLAFLPKDDKAHVLYTSDVPVEVYQQDLPKLVKGELP